MRRWRDRCEPVTPPAVDASLFRRHRRRSTTAATITVAATVLFRHRRRPAATADTSTSATERNIGRERTIASMSRPASARASQKAPTALAPADASPARSQLGPAAASGEQAASSGERRAARLRHPRDTRSASAAPETRVCALRTEPAARGIGKRARPVRTRPETQTAFGSPGCERTSLNCNSCNRVTFRTES